MKRVTTFIFAAGLFCANAAAQVSGPELQNIINNQNGVIQRQEQFEQEKIREKELKKVETERERIEGKEVEDDSEEIGSVIQRLRSIRCFRINKIELSQNKLISKAQEKILTENYLGKCLSIEQINSLQKEMHAYLVEKGYTTSRVEVPMQHLATGVLKIKIIEAYIEKLLLNNDEKFSDKTQKFTAFPMVKEGEILNLRKIEQGLDQMNRLSSNRATVKVEPGIKKDNSRVLIENAPQNRTRLNASYDNFGNKITGDRRETIGLNHDNLFWLNDNISINRTANDFDQTRKKDGGTKVVSGIFSVPFGWYNLTLNYTKSSYFFWSGNVQRFKSTGETATRSATLDRVLIKNNQFKLGSSLAFTNRNNQNFIDETKIETSSRKASFATLAFPATFFLNESTLFLKPSYSKALNILNAKQDAPQTPSRSVHAEFNIYKFYGNYSKKFAINEKPFSYNLTFDSQLSQKKLYGNDQFAIGSIYSIRGFKNGTISGDSGYSLRNDISFNLGHLFSVDKFQLNHFLLAPFYDYGYVRAKGGFSSGRLSGTGIKISYNRQNLNASLTYSRALSKSHLLGQNYRDNDAIFFSIASDISFN